MFLAAIMICSNMAAESCFPIVNNRQAFFSYDECYEHADLVAQAVIASDRYYSTSPYCFPLNFGEPA
jgi:hypothetical protein